MTFSVNKSLQLRVDTVSEFNTLEYMDTQIFTVNKIEDFDYFNHGDQTFNRCNHLSQRNNNL
jgi:hypothetical protein